MRPELLSCMSQKGRSYFQLFSVTSFACVLTYSLVCQYVKDLVPGRDSGEYRGRTDDLLHAMQAL